MSIGIDVSMPIDIGAAHLSHRSCE